MNPDRIKSIRNNMIITSILLLLVGVAFIVWPGEAARVLARVVAIAIAVFGAFELILFFIGSRKSFVDVSAAVTGVLLTALGVFLLIKPDTLLNFFNIIFGIAILIVGLDHIFQSIFIIRHVRGLWWISLLVGVAALLLGVIIIINPFSAVNTAMILIGITMVIEAIGGFWNLPALKPKKGIEVIDAKPVDSADDDMNA